MTWKKAVIKAIERYTRKKGTGIFQRKDLIKAELSNIVIEAKSSGKTPEQTLSRILQELRDDKVIKFTGNSGNYIYLRYYQSELLPNKPSEVIVNNTEVGNKKQYREGSIIKVYTNRYERNKRAKKDCIEYYGLCCSVCGFKFSDKYGKIGERYIHVHHIIPLSEIGNKYEIDPINDLRPVCANCHAMLHAKTPPYTIEELKVIIFKTSNQNR